MPTKTKKKFSLTDAAIRRLTPHTSSSKEAKKKIRRLAEDALKHLARKLDDEHVEPDTRLQSSTVQTVADKYYKDRDKEDKIIQMRKTKPGSRKLHLPYYRYGLSHNNISTQKAKEIFGNTSGIKRFLVKHAKFSSMEVAAVDDSVLIFADMMIEIINAADERAERQGRTMITSEYLIPFEQVMTRHKPEKHAKKKNPNTSKKRNK